MQIRQASAVLARLSAAERAGRWHLDGLSGFGSKSRLLQSLQERDDRLGSQVLVVVVVDLHHGGIDASTKALDLDESEQIVLRRVSRGDAKVVRDGLDNLVATAATELARCLDKGRSVSAHCLRDCFACKQDDPIVNKTSTYRSADLHEVLAHWFPVKHRVEGCDLVDTHRGHLQDPCDLVHDTDAGEAMLALSQVQKRHDSGLLILRGVALKDLIDESEVLLIELERDRGVVVRLVSMLEEQNISIRIRQLERKQDILLSEAKLGDCGGGRTKGRNIPRRAYH